MLSIEVRTNNRRKFPVDIQTFALHIHFDRWWDRSTQLSDPIFMFVANVPDHTESSAGMEDTCDLGAGHLNINPVPCLRAENGVDGASGERKILGSAVED